MEPGIAKLIDELLDTTVGRIEDLADEAGVSYSALYSWATGRRRPSRKNLKRLARAASRRADRLAEVADGIEARANGAAPEETAAD